MRYAEAGKRSNAAHPQQRQATAACHRRGSGHLCDVHQALRGHAQTGLEADVDFVRSVVDVFLARALLRL